MYQSAPSSHSIVVPNAGNGGRGHVKVILHEGKALHNTQCCSRMDPFVKMTLGPNDERSEVCKSGGVIPKWPSNPTFQFEIGANPKYPYDKLKIEVINHNVFCNDDIGEVEVPVQRLIDEAQQAADAPAWIWLGRKNNINTKAGELCATIKYIPPMSITLLEARNLYDVQLLGKQDPYVLLEMSGCLAKGDDGKRRSKTHEDGAQNPKWNETFFFNVLDGAGIKDLLAEMKSQDNVSAREKKKQEPGLWLQVVDENIILDTNIGYCFISLAQLLEAKKSGQPEWFQLFKGKKEAGGKEDCGRVCLRVNP